MVCPSRS